MGSSMLLLGEIVRPWGTKGEVKLLPYGDLGQILPGRDGLYLEKGESAQFLVLEGFRYHKSFVILKFKDGSDYQSAEKLSGCKVSIPRETAPALPESTYYHHDIIGLRVISEGNPRGRIAQIWDTGANDVYVVEDEGEEWLLPATKEIIRRVDLEKGELHIEDTIGLMNLENI